jgi:aminopeptidase N
MVRLVAGDRATFDAIRELFAAPIGRPLELGAVRAALERHAGRSLGRVFADWFERAGAPQFEASLRSFPAAGGGFRADVALVQKRGAYALPVEIVIYGPGDERRETVEIADEATSLFYVLPFEPKRIEVDPLNRIFRWK